MSVVLNPVRVLLALGAVVLGGLCVVLGGAAGETTPRAVCRAAGGEETIAGWCATYAPPGAKAGGGEGGGVVRAWAAAPAFALQKGQSFHPLCAAAPMEARFDGVVTVPTRGKYRFGAICEGGEARLTVFGGKLAEPVFLSITSEKWTDWIDLAAGPVNVRYTFVRAKDVPVRLRAMWERQKRGLDGFFAEAIPTGAVEVGAADVASVRADREGFAGRVLVGELACTACHAAPRASGAVLTRRGPDLQRVGERASIGWMSRFIADPQGTKPGCGMPGLVAGGAAGADEAASIAHYLASLSRGGAPAAAPRGEGSGAGDAQRGSVLFRQIGCVACHGVPGVETSGFVAAAPHGDLASKWRRGALAAFLREPESCRQGGRMPSLLLTEGEAVDIEAYLLSVWGEAPAVEQDAVDAARVELGRAAFGARSCAACHALAGQSAAPAKPMARVDVEKGCLDSASGKGARYSLDAARSAAVRAGVEQIKRASGAVAPTDLAARTLEAMSCVRCHFHDKGEVPELLRSSFVTKADGAAKEGPDLGDEGRLPPTLVGAGAKLAPAWVSEVLSKGARARPYMSARMPVFSAEALGALAPGLACTDGVWGRESPAAQGGEPTDADVQAGRTLVGTGGLNCISCHTFDSIASGTVGVELTTMTTRLRRDWFDRYMKAPDRFKPGTRMPNFYLTGTGPTVDVFGGDAHKQVGAMWSYLSRGAGAPVPEGVRAAKAGGEPAPEPGSGSTSGGGSSTVLAPAPASGGAGGWDACRRAMVFRAKFPESGPRSIGVGSRDGVHFVFDADACMIRYAWTGGFADASGSWDGRAGETLGGLGTVVWRNGAATGVPCRFEGYALDAEGVPTFRYRQGASARVRLRAGPVPLPERPASPPLQPTRAEPAPADGATKDGTVGTDAQAGSTGLLIEVAIEYDDASQAQELVIAIAGAGGGGWAGVTVIDAAGAGARVTDAGVIVTPGAGVREARIVVRIGSEATR